jgi:hypothetical protein
MLSAHAAVAKHASRANNSSHEMEVFRSQMSRAHCINTRSASEREDCMSQPI